jgi:hypothetical protein
MMTPSSTSEADHILYLVREALDQFEDVSLDASLRRVLRIAQLRGNSEQAWWARIELRGSGGGSRAEAARQIRELWPEAADTDVRRAHQRLLEEWLEERTPNSIPAALESSIGKDQVLGGSIVDLQRSHDARSAEAAALHPANVEDLEIKIGLEQRAALDREILERIRYRTHSYLCSCEIELRFGSTSSTILDRHRIRVDRHLGLVGPDVVEKLNAAYRRARDGDGESLSHALTSCRRVLNTVAGVVFPPRSKPYLDRSGVAHDVGSEKYRNRLVCFIDFSQSHGRAAGLCHSILSEFADRLEKLDSLASKGVHSDVTQSEVDLCVIQTYLLCGEVLTLYDASGPIEQLADDD